MSLFMSSRINKNTNSLKLQIHAVEAIVTPVCLRSPAWKLKCIEMTVSWGPGIGSSD